MTIEAMMATAVVTVGLVAYLALDAARYWWRHR